MREKAHVREREGTHVGLGRLCTEYGSVTVNLCKGKVARFAIIRNDITFTPTYTKVQLADSRIPRA